MRRLALLAFLFTAFSAQATWYPQFSRTSLVLRPGEQQTLEVVRRWSGITDYGFGGWTFSSDNATVAVAAGGVAINAMTGTIHITAREPGIARIGIRDSNGGLYWTWVTVAVVADPVQEALYVAGPRTVRVGERVTYTTFGPDVSAGATVQWYWGALGDTRFPNQAGPELELAPASEGASDYWVMVVTPRSLSTAAFTVTTVAAGEKLPPSRRRSARH